MSFLEDAWQLCLEKLERIRQLDGFPYLVENGRWLTTDARATGFMPAHGSWTVGFTPGMLWLADRATGRHAYAEDALVRCRQIAHRQHDDSTHDLGFVFYPSYVQGYALSGEAWLRDGAVQAARSLARRFNPAGRYLRAWGPLDSPERAGQTTIDAMMNLALLYWAAEETGDGDLSAVATAHAETTSRTLVRPDGSTYHVYTFDPSTGQPLGGSTHQGYADESTWLRGQAWGLYGFAQAARYVNRPEFRALAERLADVFMGCLPPDRLPYWDCSAGEPRDSSAAAVAASGLIELDRRLEALDLLEALYTSSSSRGRPDQPGVLLHGTWHRPAGYGVDTSIIFGDYYFMEAVWKCSQHELAA